MKKGISILLFVIMTFFTISNVKADSEIVEVYLNGEQDYDMANEIVELTNEEREKEGLEPFKISTYLMEFAYVRAKELPLYFEHVKPDDTKLLQYPYRTSENIIWGYGTAKAAVKGWMNSDGHRENILSTTSKSIGVGCYRTNNGGPFCVQVFSVGLFEEQQALTGKIKYEKDPVRINSSYLNISIKPLENNSIKIKEGEIFDNNKMISKNYTYDTFYTSGALLNNESAIWTSNDENVATVDSAGNITGISAGSTTITAKIGDITKSGTVTIIKSGDINNDGVVDLLDVKQLFRIYMVASDRSSEEFIKKYDFDDDETVDLLDVKKLFRLYMTGYFE